MKGYKLIFMLIVVITLSSCATIRFGRSTTVTIETEHPGDVVDILAIGPKKAVELQQVTLPYKYKVRHNNLPQRVDIFSNNNIYDPFTIGAVHKGKLIGTLSKWTGWATAGSTGTVMAVVGDFSAEVMPVWGGFLGLGAALLTIGYTAETDIPNSKFYLTNSVPVDSLKMHQLEGWYIKQKALDDVYTLLSQGDYKLSKAKASFLIESEPTAELFYLRGISSYYLGEHKQAKADLNESLYRLNAEINPGLRDEVIECISAVDESIAIQKEKRNQRWAQIAGTLLEAGAQAYNIYQQNEALKYRQSHGMSPSGVVVDPSLLSNKDLNHLIDPNFAVQQVLSQEWQEYQQFCRYNKKSDGSDYTLDEYRAFQGAVIQQAKEDGFDIIAEQRKQMEEDKKWREEQNKKDKERWFARYGYSTRASSPSTDNSISSSSSNTSSSTYNSTSSKSSNTSSSDASSSSSSFHSKGSNSTPQNSDEKELDSKQQFKSDPVSSEDYRRIKSIELYCRDGNKAHKMDIRAELYKKGAYLYVKIGNIFYPRRSPNWQRFRNAIAYGHQQLYFND